MATADAGSLAAHTTPLMLAAASMDHRNQLDIFDHDPARLANRAPPSTH